MGMMLRRNIKARAAKPAPKKTKKVEEAVKPIVVEEPAIEEPKEVTNEVEWTAEEINKMPYMKLKSIAKKNGVEVTDKEASDIRSELIEKLGL